MELTHLMSIAIALHPATLLGPFPGGERRIRLATSSARWDRLNRILCVGRGERRRDDVTIHVHEVT